MLSLMYGLNWKKRCGCITVALFGVEWQLKYESCRQGEVNITYSLTLFSILSIVAHFLEWAHQLMRIVIGIVQPRPTQALK
jgi:hypothetical protein